MLWPVIVSESENEIFYKIPPGKIVFQGGSVKRVYSAASNATCCYVAMERMLRIDVYPNRENPTTNLSADFAKFITPKGCSLEEVSKILNELEQSLSTLEEEENKRLFNDQYAGLYKGTSKEAARLFLASLEMITPDLSLCGIVSASLQVRASMYPAGKLQDFIDSDFENFYDFLFDSYCKEKLEIIREFIIKLSEPDPLLELVFDIVKDLPPLEQINKLQNFMQVLCLTICHFKTSTWCAQNGIEKLVEELSTFGPFLVSGAFGKSYYKTPPGEAKATFCNPIDQTLFFGWAPRSERNDCRGLHTIVVVGAQKDENAKGGGYVFFVDPNDESKPDVVEKVYKISFENLSIHIKSSPLAGGEAFYATSLLA